MMQQRIKIYIRVVWQVGEILPRTINRAGARGGQPS